MSTICFVAAKSSNPHVLKYASALSFPCASQLALMEQPAMLSEPGAKILKNTKSYAFAMLQKAQILTH